MDTFIVLAGGYWHQSRKPDLGGMQVDPNDGDAKRTVDYIIKIKGLPDHFIQPIEVVRKQRFYCETCRRWVKEIEIQEKAGCFVAKDHKLRLEQKDVEMWETGVYDRYEIEKQKWITPCVRIFLNNSKGVDKWRDIWRYVEMTYPTTKRLKPDFMPKAVGTRNSWEISESDVPVIDLSFAYESTVDKVEIIKDWTPIGAYVKESIVASDKTLFERPEEKPTMPQPKREINIEAERAKTEIPQPPENLLKCPHCDAMLRGGAGLSAHVRSRHKDKLGG